MRVPCTRSQQCESLSGFTKQLLPITKGEAKDYIEELLADGSAMLAVDIEKRLKEKGICRSTAGCAKRELGILSVRVEGQWYWKLPQAG